MSTTIPLVLTPVALTTTFTPRSSCLTSYAIVPFSTSTRTVTYSPTVSGFTSSRTTYTSYSTITSSYTKLGPTDAQGCLPEDIQPTRDFYYSPGIICPSGYNRTVATPVVIGGTATETRAICCPSKFVYTTITATYTPDLSTLGCRYDYTNYRSTATVAGPSTTGVDGLDYNLWAWSVQIRWQATDLEKASVTPTNLPVTTTSASNGGLSTGAKVGIGVGVPFAVLALLTAFLLGLLLSRRRKQAANGPSPSIPPPQSSNPPSSAVPPPAHETKSLFPWFHRHKETPSPAPTESKFALPTAANPSELDSRPVDSAPVTNVPYHNSLVEAPGDPPAQGNTTYYPPPQSSSPMPQYPSGVSSTPYQPSRDSYQPPIREGATPQQHPAPQN